MSYTPDPQLTHLENLKQEFLEIDPYLRNLYESVANLRKGVQAERLNMSIKLAEGPYIVKPIQHQHPTDYFIRHGALSRTLEVLESCADYKTSVSLIEPMLAQIEQAEKEEIELAEKVEAATQELKAAEARAKEKALKCAEVQKAQEALQELHSLKK